MFIMLSVLLLDHNFKSYKHNIFYSICILHKYTYANKQANDNDYIDYL